MFQDPKGYIAQMCEIHLQGCSMETVQQNGGFLLFCTLYLSISLILNLF